MGLRSHYNGQQSYGLNLRLLASKSTISVTVPFHCSRARWLLQLHTVLSLPHHPQLYITGPGCLICQDFSIPALQSNYIDQVPSDIFVVVIDFCSFVLVDSITRGTKKNAIFCVTTDPSSPFDCGRVATSNPTSAK